MTDAQAIREAEWEKYASSGVIRIAQHNDTRTISIIGLSEALIWLLGFDHEVLRGQELRSILTSQMADAIDEQVEFTAEGVDIAEMLSRYSGPSLLTATGEVVPIEVRVHGAGLDGDDVLYDMVVKTAGLEEHRMHDQTLAYSMAIRGEEHLDSQIGVPDRPSFEKDLELLLHLEQQNPEAESCLAVLRLCNYARVSVAEDEAVATRLLKLCAYACRDNIRHDDIVGRVADDTLCILLLDTDMPAAPLVINRIRMAMKTLHLAGKEGQDLMPEVSFALMALESTDTVESVMKNVDQTLKGQMAAYNPHNIIHMRE